MSLDRYIQVKKLLFLRTVTVMDDNSICKRILNARTVEFNLDRGKSRLNENDSPIFEILNTSIDVGMFDVCMNTILNGHYYSKEKWKELVWKNVWIKEDDDIDIMYKQPSGKHLLFDIIEKPYYIIWWIISDNFPRLISMCEKMAALVCGCSLLKGHDLKLKRATFWSKCCTRCTHSTIEDTKHIVMQCPYFDEARRRMYNDIDNIGNDDINNLMKDAGCVYKTLMECSICMFEFCFVKILYLL